MATTPNFGWTTPNDTDYVKDGASAIRTLGNAIDASMADLEGGTTGQVLSKNSNTDMDFVWVTPNDADAIQNTIVDAKGDLISATAADTPARLAVGANGEVLTADSTTATGLKWAAAPSGLTLITRSTFSNVASHSITGCFTTSYATYVVVMEGVYSATLTDNMMFQMLYGSTAAATNYYGGLMHTVYNTTTFTHTNQNGTTQFDWSLDSGNSAQPQSAVMWFGNVGTASCRPWWYGNGIDSYNQRFYWYSGMQGTAQAYDGIKFFSTAANVSGTVAIYGVAK